MFTRKSSLLALPIAAILLHGCGGGGPPKTRPNTNAGNTTGATTAGNTTAGGTMGAGTAGSTTGGSTVAGVTTGGTTTGTTAGATAGSTTAGTTAGDNIGRFSGVVDNPDQGDPAFDSTDFVPTARGLRPIDAQFTDRLTLTQTKRNLPGMPDSVRFLTLGITGTGSTEFQVGRSYSLEPSNSGDAFAFYSQQVQDASSPIGERRREFVNDGGTFIVDSATRDGSGQLTAISFRIINATFRPIASPNSPSTFTLNYSGDAFFTPNS